MIRPGHYLGPIVTKSLPSSSNPDHTLVYRYQERVNATNPYQPSMSVFFQIYSQALDDWFDLDITDQELTQFLMGDPTPIFQKLAEKYGPQDPE